MGVIAPSALSPLLLWAGAPRLLIVLEGQPAVVRHTDPAGWGQAGGKAFAPCFLPKRGCRWTSALCLGLQGEGRRPVAENSQ